MAKLTHIPCDCATDCTTCVRRAAYICERDGKTINLCTRCKLSGDTVTHRLFDREDIPELAKLDGEAYGHNPIADTLDGFMTLSGGMTALLEGYLDDVPRGGTH